jgi:hypothetical protein
MHELASTRNRQQQHGDSIVTMATAVFVTKKPPTDNIIISITKIVITIVDAFSLSLIVVSLIKGMIWLDMVAT